MDIVTILEDAKVDSHPQNDVDLGAAQQVTTTSLLPSSSPFRVNLTFLFVCLLKMLRMKFLGHHLAKVIPDQQPVLELVNNALDIKAVSIHTT